MSHPDIVQAALGDESVAARVPFGDDALFVTPTRTLVYRADSLLSDESVEEFPHGAERIDVSTGRRKATITLDYGLDGERSFTVPRKALDRALHPVLAGTLNAAGVTDPGETVKETFRFSELTLVVTSDRLVKHVGSAVWDEEFEEYHFSEVTDFAVEEGNVAMTLVLTHDGRQERFKAPTDRAREVTERLTEALVAYHDVDSLATLRERFAVDEEETPSATMSFGEGPTPLSANPSELADRPGNATQHGDSDGAGDTDDDHTDASAAGGAVDAMDVETADAGDAADSAGGTEPEPSPPDESTAADAGAEFDIDSIGTGDLLGPVDTDADADTDTDADTSVETTPPEPEAVASDDGDRDEELAALVAEVAALRETVEEQNERIAEQEELLKRLIAELRTRL